ncbi:MAG: 2OG-Fe dioxygenase family protein [Steroidobacteraceae bacterium]
MAQVVVPPPAAHAPVVSALTRAGYAHLSAAAAREALGVDTAGLDACLASWADLPRDTYLRDGGSYRTRRHSCFVQTPGTRALEAVAHRAHWQPTAYNALHGGIERWFEPIAPAVVGSSAWRGLVGGIGELFAAMRPVARWYIEAHQFRIDTAHGIGRPTPEGAHRDGVDFVALVLAARRDIEGGETRVFDAAGSSGLRFTMREPWSVLLLDDARVIHETTPIRSRDQRGVRDTLVLTYRERGFQAPGA